MFTRYTSSRSAGLRGEVTQRCVFLERSKLLLYVLACRAAVLGRGVNFHEAVKDQLV